MGVPHVVLDTPGGIHGFEPAKVVMSAHAILVPVCHSVFDRESAAVCIGELMSLPRLASGRCKIGIVGMRIDARTRAAETLKEWADSLDIPFLGVLREARIYVRSLDSGQTIFDQRNTAVQTDLDQWEPILQWLQPVTQLQPPAPQPVPAPAPTPVHTPRAPSLMRAQESLVHGSRLSVFSQAALRQ